MNVTTEHFTLSPEQLQFKEMLSSCPWMLPYWDFENRECDLEALERALGVLSHGEQIMARFFIAVWLGNNIYSFDLIEASILDDEYKDLIIKWFANPVFP